jgi:ABC-2 type transport system ATP-binding protein
MNVIEATDLHKSYGDVPAVVDINLNVASGEVVAVLGPNGAGKTTTIEMLLGLRSPSRGSVSVFGKPPRHVDVRGRVGAMLQDTDAPESLTVTETVELVGHYYPYALPTADVLRRADLSQHATKRVTQLSGGQRQRLSFALAIVGDPDLLFLDEPTASLDVQARQAFWRQVEEFSRLGKTILFSTHNLLEADLAADRIVVINQGRIVRDGTPTQIKALLPAKTITLTTDANLQELRRLEGVKSAVPVSHSEAHAIPASQSYRLQRVQLQVAIAEPVLRALFAAHHVEDLTVTEASLEQAFLHLTGETLQDEPEPAPLSTTTATTTAKGQLT